MKLNSLVRLGPITRLKAWLSFNSIQKPLSSEVLSVHLKTENQYWSSYFVKYASVVNDQFGCSHFNWRVGDHNYHILRIGCYPFIKYHCTRRPQQDLTFENNLFTILKVLNLGVPTLLYGISALFLAKVSKTIETSAGNVVIYFYDKEEPNSRY